MAWFGWKPGRAEARPGLARCGFAPAPGSWPQGYEAQVRAGYLGNPVAQRAVKLVAEAVGAAPFDAPAEALDAPLAHGAVVLAAHLFDARDGGAQPPAAVAALWRPYRRLRLAWPDCRRNDAAPPGPGSAA